jgi:hypothetical protein
MFDIVSSTIQLILAGVVGLLIGLLVSTLFNREPKSNSETSLPKDLTQEGYSEAARLLYSPSTKKVVTQLDGDFYKEFVPLTPDQRKRVLRLLQVWMEWCGQSAPHAETAEKPTLASEKPQDAVKSATESMDKRPSMASILPVDSILADSILAEPAKIDDLSELGIKVPEIVKPIPAVITVGANLVKPGIKEPLSIVEQINEVINKLTAGTVAEKRNIRLAENGHEGITVWVGMYHYDGVDAVPFPEVQQLIRAAVARWEEETEAQTRNADKK